MQIAIWAPQTIKVPIKTLAKSDVLDWRNNHPVGSEGLRRGKCRLRKEERENPPLVLKYRNETQGCLAKGQAALYPLLIKGA